MTHAVQTHAVRESFLARTWRVLREIDEAIHTTDLDLMYARVNRLERELAELKARGATGLPGNQRSS
jgi:hypothetical protein